MKNLPKNKLNIFVTILFIVTDEPVFAGSATWKASPVDSEWNNPSNWTPATVPNGVSDVATFGVSNLTTLEADVSAFHPLAELVFNPGASAFTLNLSDDLLVIYGAGISNSSGTLQTFAISEGQSIGFHNSATAGDQTNFTLAPKVPFVPGMVFYDAATAGTASYTISGSVTGNVGGELQFIGLSSAAEGLFSNLGGNGADSQGGLITFYDSAKGGNGIFTNEGGINPNALGASTVFADTSNAENATLIARGGVAGGGGATIKFAYAATGGDARVELFGNGSLDLHLASGPVSVGSLEGDGLVSLGVNSLTVGSNRLSTTFSGLIKGSGQITKTGKSTLTLSGANTYSGGTVLTQGTLRVSNTSGSATGSGSIQMDGGIIGGTGTIAGETSLGPGSTAPAILKPSAGGKKPATVTFQSALHFKGSSYNYLLDTRRAQGDQVVANGVSIENQDAFNVSTIANNPLAIGQVFVVISNTAATPISGVFGDLADGATLRVGRNRFQANYEGGDGNDLTLTVIP